jgi:hypothetical protein
MFYDLAGSTALPANLDPEDLRGIITQLITGCWTELVERNGGFVAKYMSDRVLAYFGYPQRVRLRRSGPLSTHKCLSELPSKPGISNRPHKAEPASPPDAGVGWRGSYRYLRLVDRNGGGAKVALCIGAHHNLLL